MRQNVRKTGLRVGATLIWPPASQEWRGLAGCHSARPSYETPILVTGGDPLESGFGWTLISRIKTLNLSDGSKKMRVIRVLFGLHGLS